MFIGMITVTIILYLFFLSIVKRKKEKGKLSEKHSPYDFESSQQNVINKSFNFQKYLYSGDYVEVIKEFKDYYGFTHQVGEKFYFVYISYLMKMDILYLFQKIKLILVISFFKTEQKLKKRFVIT